MTVRRQLSRLLLPEGSGRLRSDLGAFLKRRRQGRLDSEPFGTQAQIARRVGITRQTLSEIERGAAWPGPATLDVLLDILDLGWEHVAHSIASGAIRVPSSTICPGAGGWPRCRSPRRPRAIAPFSKVQGAIRSSRSARR
ncbi:helix-turn-helix transcriptional regulator [Sphingomonas aerolata]|uniref:helix-turn-helix transcriptional regulator n=1 Tax=Sphingomonas aerolata TaxID=185951 RepID=UPI003A5C2E87